MNATIHYVTGASMTPVESVLPCTPFIGMRVEFFDGDRDVELAGIVESVVARDLDGDVDLHVYTRLP